MIDRLDRIDRLATQLGMVRPAASVRAAIRRKLKHVERVPDEQRPETRHERLTRIAREQR